MYMRGLSDLWATDPTLNTPVDVPSTDWTSVSYTDPNAYAPTPVAAPASSGAGTSFDWGSMFKSAVSAYGQVKTINAQADAIASRSAAPAGYQMTPNGLMPAASPYYRPATAYPAASGSIMGLSPMTLLLAAGGAVAAYTLLK